MIHALAWFCWAGGALVILSITRNPLYLALTLVAIALVIRSIRVVEPSASAMIPLRFGLIVVALSALFNALNVHTGQHVLFRLPDGIPLLGGIITWEALVYGALNGLALTGIVAAFLSLSRAVPVRSMVRLVPRAFYPIAVVISIALTYIPTLLREFRHIREAQAVRGHDLRHISDWLPLFMPLFIGGLERAWQLAEAMVARGFASSEEALYTTASRLAIAGGLVVFVLGWLLELVWQKELVGTLLLLAGLGAILIALWAVGRRVPGTQYRSQPWTSQDWAIVLGVGLAVAAVALRLPGLDRAGILYYPYPALTWPQFSPVVGAALLGLLAPALANRRAAYLKGTEHDTL